MIVRLTSAQVSMASHVAVMRRICNQQKALEAKHGAPTDAGSWEIDIDACCAEVALARYLNLFWCGTVNDFGRRDVGDLVDARHTGWPNGRLRLHRDDPDGVPFVLVTGHPPTFDLVGWLFAHEGKQQRWWCDPTGKNRPAFFVPRDAPLHDMGSLRSWVERMRKMPNKGEDAA